MPRLRPYEGPPPGHPIGVVPEDAGRGGALVRVRGWEVAVADPDGTITSLGALGDRAEEIGWAGPRVPGLPPFDGGLVGFITDEESAGLLGLPDTGDVRPDPAALPTLWFGSYGGAACRSPEGTWWLAGQTHGDLDHAEELLRDAAHRGEAGPGTHAATPPTTPGGSPPPAWSTLDRTAHAAAVATIKGWIADGDVYQVNLTMHVGAPWPGTPLALAKALFDANDGAAHAAFVRTPGATITSVSPETFLRTDRREVTVRPIKGTRRRSADPAEDAALAAALRGSSKDRAEHVMIVDLERNDLGRIAVTGTVRVPELMALEAHPTVWHLTSTVRATLRDDVTFGDLLAATFPCGSVTGAPKRMAVQRTALVEPWRRGVYCGAIGVVTAGLVDLSVAIRTAVLADGVAWYGTGGGIVADSDADEEWDEALSKAQAFLTATGTRAPDGTGLRPTSP